MKLEKSIRANEVKAGDEVRFERERKHRRVMTLLPMSDDKTMIVIPGHGNFLMKNDTVVYRKI